MTECRTGWSVVVSTTRTVIRSYAWSTTRITSGIAYCLRTRRTTPSTITTTCSLLITLTFSTTSCGRITWNGACRTVKTRITWTVIRCYAWSATKITSRSTYRLSTISSLPLRTTITCSLCSAISSSSTSYRSWTIYITWRSIIVSRTWTCIWSCTDSISITILKQKK